MHRGDACSPTRASILRPPNDEGAPSGEGGSPSVHRNQGGERHIRIISQHKVGVLPRTDADAEPTTYLRLGSVFAV